MKQIITSPHVDKWFDCMISLCFFGHFLKMIFLLKLCVVNKSNSFDSSLASTFSWVVGMHPNHWRCDSDAIGKFIAIELILPSLIAMGTLGA